MTTFTRDTHIFRDEDMLRDDYQPDSITARESELGSYQTALQPVINGAQPRNTFLYGKTGVGKTSVSRYILNQLQRDSEQYDDVSLSVFWLNCTNLFVLPGGSQPCQYVTFRRRSDQYDWLPAATRIRPAVQRNRCNRGTVLIVLDEIDHIGNDDEILYEIPRARSNGYLTETKTWRDWHQQRLRLP